MPLSYLALGLFAFAAGFAVARHRYATADQTDQRYDSDPIESTAGGHPIPWGKVLFTGAWLGAWTIAILVVWGMLLDSSGSAKLFVVFWLIAAKVGWVMAVRQLTHWLQGKGNLFRR